MSSLLDTGGRTVPAEWVDYNGHMNDAYYFVAFTEATEAFLDHIGLGEAYRESSGCGIYTVESHLCFKASVRGGEMISYRSQLLGYDTKRLHIFHQIITSDGAEAATNELMFLHVELATERVTAMPSQRLAVVAALAAKHAELPLPEQAGRRIAMPAKSVTPGVPVT
jgi:acyl-CoA thioester hydrolase